MNLIERCKLPTFLANYPGISIAPSRDASITLIGTFNFSAQISAGLTINDSYLLKIVIPSKFPKDIPKVEEIDHKIPRHGNYHINPDGTLCLGSHLRLLYEISRRPSILGFTELCLTLSICRKL